MRSTRSRGEVPAVRRCASHWSSIRGENGAGKSTLLEGLAMAVGMNAEGGSQNMAFSTRASHSALHHALRVTRSGARPRPRWWSS